MLFFILAQKISFANLFLVFLRLNSFKRIVLKTRTYFPKSKNSDSMINKENKLGHTGKEYIINGSEADGGYKYKSTEKFADFLWRTYEMCNGSTKKFIQPVFGI